MVHRGIDLIGDLLAGKPGVKGLTWFAVGAGDPAWDTTPATGSATATALKSEIARVPLTAANFATDDTKHALTISASFAPALLTQPLREFGVFGGDASALPGSGYLFDYRTHPVLAVPTTTPLNRAIAITWKTANLLNGAWAAIAGLLRGDASATGVTDWAEGSGLPAWDTTAPAIDPAVKGLTTEVFRTSLRSGRNLVYDPVSHTLTAQVSLGFNEAAAPLRESGLFAGGSLIAYQTFPVFDKTTPQVLRQQFRLELSGDHFVAVPNLTNLKAADAASALGTAGLAIDPLLSVEDSAHVGIVVSFFPAAGAIVPAGSRVAVTVGVQPSVITPNVLGLSPDDAASVLKQHGLTSADGGKDIVPPDGIPGGILRQLPVPGQRVPAGSAISLTLGIPRNVTVPDLTGATVARALLLLSQADLVADDTQPLVESDEEPGTVVAQDPAANSAALRFSKVQISVATARTIVVPDLSGQALPAVNKLLQDASDAVGTALGRNLPNPILAVGDVAQQASLAPRDTVVAQNPAAGARVPWHTTIQVTLSKPATVVVPDVTGLTPDKATAAITAAQLIVGASTTEQSVLPPNLVLTQSPTAGSSVDAGTAVSIFVSTAFQVTVPSIIGLKQEEAQEVLKGRGFVYGDPIASTGAQPDGTVIGQNPAAGALATFGSAVTATVILTNKVPNLVGLPVATATTQLTAAKFKVTTTPLASPQPIGNVLAQSPVANVSAPVGSTVTLTVAQGVAVPDMTGHLTGEFAAQLAAGQFTVTIQSTTPGSQPIGTVVSQQPTGGTVVPLKTVIQVVETSGATVPNVFAQTPGAAKAALDALKLVLTTAGATTGVAIAQQPAAGTVVPIGATVTITLGDPSLIVAVPSLIGDSLQEATAKLSALNLKIQRGADVISIEGTGTVVIQGPGPGVRVLKGTVVTVRLARPRLAGGAGRPFQIAR